MNGIGTVRLAIKNDSGLFLRVDLLAEGDVELGEIFNIEMSNGRFEFEAVEVTYGQYGKELMVRLSDARKVILINVSDIIGRPICR